MVVLLQEGVVKLCHLKEKLQPYLKEKNMKGSKKANYNKNSKPVKKKATAKKKKVVKKEDK